MRFLKPGVPAALLACALFGNAAAADALSTPMPPAAAQKEASVWMARVLERYRYKPEGQLEGVGARPFDRFIDALDPEHMLFTQADLAAMADLRSQLDKLSDEKQMEIPNAIFARYLARADAMYAYALELLRKPLDFSGHERYQRGRSTAAREPDEAALRALWRRRVMDDILNLRQAGSPEAQVVPTLQRRYEGNLQRTQALDSADVANVFLNAYAEYYDPHGNYIGPPKAKSERTPPGMVGLGMVLQTKGDLTTVLEVAPGSPAWRSGDVVPGDRIVGVAQGSGQPMTEVFGWRIDEVVALLRGLPGSQVVLDVLPQGAPRGSTPRRVPLTRARIQLEDQRARGRIEQVRHGALTYRIGVVAVPTFYLDFAARKAGATEYASVTRDVAAALEQLKAQNADAILLDMRGNGGGSLTEAIDFTGLFLPGVPVVQQLGSDHKLLVESAPTGAPVWDGPLAILVDRRSAAATEITAAAIQDYGRGLVIGDTSYGRGSVQTLISLDRFSKEPGKRLGELKMTIAVLCRANGKPLQRAGVTPDIVAPGRIDVSGKANADLFPNPQCKAQDIAKRADLDGLLPQLATQHAARMQAERGYQAQIERRTREEALLASDDVSLNEAERRSQPAPKAEGDIARSQLDEALRVMGDAVDLMRKRAGST